MSEGETFAGWFKPDKTQVPQSSSATVRVVRVDNNTFRLKFTHVKVEEGGEYECRSRSGSKGTFTLEVVCKCRIWIIIWLLPSIIWLTGYNFVFEGSNN